MASGSGPIEEPHITFNVKSSSDAKYVLTLPTLTTVADLKAKLSTSEYADIPVNRIRLIYSGRVLKDPDSLETVKIKDGHTVHLVKGAESNVRQNPSNQASSTSESTGPGGSAPASNVPSNIAAGTGNNPLAALTGARYAGFHNLPGAEMFGPDGGMGPPTDSDSLLRMLDNPQFLSQMNEAMNNPAIIEMMSNSPMMRDNPMARQMLQNPDFRRMLTNPEVIRTQLQMQRQMQRQGGGEGDFPAPGMTDNTPRQAGQQEGQGQEGNIAGGAQGQQQPGADPLMNPFSRMMFGNRFPSGPGAGDGAGAGAGAGNPFAALFNAPNAPNLNATAGPTQSTSPPSAGSNTQNPSSETPGSAASGSAPATQDGNLAQNQAANPFAGLFGAPGGTGGDQSQNPLAQAAQNMMQNPEAMRAAMQMLGGMGGGGNAFGGGAPGYGEGNPFGGVLGGGMGMPQQPADNRPPEERYAEQLRQLNDMGFYDFERNVQALRQAGGSVQGAIEVLLGGQ